MIRPHDASLLDARVGLNLKFGRKRKPKEQLVEETADEELLIASEEAVEIPEEEVVAAAEPAAIVAPVVTYADPEPPTEIIESEPVIEEPIVAPIPDVIEVKQGEHQDELEVGHYVVVGAFLSRSNAQEYSNNLKRKGYQNDFGFLTEKDYYYVTVYKNIGDIDGARKVRDQFRAKDDFLFPDSWLLSVVE